MRLLLASLLALPAIAMAEHEQHGPCKKILAACESAGFKVGGHKKDHKGAFVDCLNKILKGETVAGVTASAEDVAACKEAKAKHEHKH